MEEVKAENKLMKIASVDISAELKVDSRIATAKLYSLLHERGLLSEDEGQESHPNFEIASFERRVAFREVFSDLMRSIQIEVSYG